jgi:hypothetical protein
MKTKIINCLTLVTLVVGCARAQTESPTNEWRATLQIVDEAGRPVAGAETSVSYFLPPSPGEVISSGKVAGLSDTNGMFVAAHRDSSLSIGFHAQKPGYYSIGRQYELGYPFQYDPIKWNPTATLVLKRIRQPVPMYAKLVNLGMPVFGKAAGFDLTVGDWVAPFGKGIHADFVFTAKLERRAENDSDYILTVSFPNHGDGIQTFEVPENEKGGGLRSAHEAPLTGYEREWKQTSIRRPGQFHQTNRNLERNYYFRVRTILDEQGNVKSTLYGKIYGDFMQFTYYLNPTPNDRNVEFDPKQNLLKGLSSLERVDAP